MMDAIIAAILFIAAFVLTWMIKHLAFRQSVLDVPNHRSLHKQPVPRGGGLSICLLVLLCLIFLYYHDRLSIVETSVVLASWFLTASIALLDDLKTVPSGIRAIVYACSAYFLVFFIQLDIHLLLKLFVPVFIVWMINLYNFMDGIDGLASIETITTSVFAVFLFQQLSAETLYWLSLTIACSTAGFLLWNWSPAKVFLGDVGSCSLGLLFSMIAILAYQKHAVPISIWLVLLSVFIVDSSLTLLKRMLSGEAWYRAHNDHAYQLLVRQGYSHKAVTTSVLLINVLLLWPLAYTIYRHADYSVFVLLLNYGILAALWFFIQRSSQKTVACRE